MGIRRSEGGGEKVRGNNTKKKYENMNIVGVGNELDS